MTGQDSFFCPACAGQKITVPNFRQTLEVWTLPDGRALIMLDDHTHNPPALELSPAARAWLAAELIKDHHHGIR